MAQLKIFVSSTYYDLMDARSSLETFIKDLGHFPILSNKGGVTYDPSKPLDESCYAEIKKADIVVLVIGGRYGSPASDDPNKGDPRKNFDSITLREHRSAIKEGKPVYTIVRRSVYDEYSTWLANKGNPTVKYTQVDNTRVFEFLEEVLALPFNNAVIPFELISEAMILLREQWSGLLQSSLRNQWVSKTIGAEVDRLADLTTKTDILLSQVVESLFPGNDDPLIQSVAKRVVLGLKGWLQNNEAIQTLVTQNGMSFEDVLQLLQTAGSWDDFSRWDYPNKEDLETQRIWDCRPTDPQFTESWNHARYALLLPAL